MKRGLLVVTIGLLVVAIILTIYASQISTKKKDVTENIVETKTSDTNIPYDWTIHINEEEKLTRAELAKYLSLAGVSKTQCNKDYEREITYIDTEPSLWYDKYINVVTVEGLFVVEGEKFEPYKEVAVGEVIAVAKGYGLEEKAKYLLKDKKPTDAISIKNWLEVFWEILEIEDLSNNFSIQSITVVGTSANISTLNEWQLVSDLGKYYYEGLILDKYIDKKINVLKRGSDIMAVISIMSKEPSIENVWIEDSTASMVKIYVGGASREYEYTDTVPVTKDKIGDIWIKDGKVVKLQAKEEYITGKILRVTDTFVEIEGKGRLDFTNTKKIYKLTNGISTASASGMLVGYDIGRFVLQEGKVCAYLIDSSTAIENIRVLISNSTMGKYTHNEISLTADVDYTVTVNGETKSYKKEEQYSIAKDDIDATIHVSTNGKGKIKLLSIKRSSRNPQYRGEIELLKADDGTINVINELPFEQYIYAVIPGEMSTKSNIEALKVQAVCARSFAYTKFYANAYRRYGAHVDDSVNCQVYNTQPEDSKSIKATDDTKGIMLMNNGAVISANFYSTSCGITANSGEVWQNSSNNDFPSNTPKYLSSRLQTEEAPIVDYSEERSFRDFITDYTVKTYDSDYGWSRWSVSMTVEQLSASINERLAKTYTTYPRFVRTLCDDGKYRSRPISTIGTVKEITIIKRGECGIAMEAKVVGTEATIIISTQANLRNLFAPRNLIEGGEDVILTRKGGGTSKNMGGLPSGFFVIDTVMKDSELSKVVFNGGGYGHGVGMSQNGVNTMINTGKTFEEVLKHYYPGISLGKK